MVGYARRYVKEYANDLLRTYDGLLKEYEDNPSYPMFNADMVREKKNQICNTVRAADRGLIANCEAVAVISKIWKGE